MRLTMKLTALLERVVNAFETGTPDGRYDAISVHRDGPHDIRQLSYGRSQVTEYGNLRELVARYMAVRGVFARRFDPYVERIGRQPLTDNGRFHTLLRRAAREDPLMRDVQDAFFRERYLVPALRWADQNGFRDPLSALVIYDSFVHSGRILNVIRGRFAAVPPAAGGSEREWILEYLRARECFLATHERPAVRKTVYRTQCLLGQVERGNWDLSRLPIRANGVLVWA